MPEISGFTIKEIAEFQQETESVFKTRLSHSGQKLKQKLEDDFPDITTRNRLFMPKTQKLTSAGKRAIGPFLRRLKIKHIIGFFLYFFH